MLTDERIHEVLKSVDREAVRLPSGFKAFARAIEVEVLRLQEPVGVFYSDSDGERWWQANKPYEYATHKLYAAPQPPAPCPECMKLTEENRKAQREIAGDIVTIRECDDLLKLSRAKVEQQKQWLIERDEYAETLRIGLALLDSKVESLLTYVPDALGYAALQAKVAELEAHLSVLRATI